MWMTLTRTSFNAGDKQGPFCTLPFSCRSNHSAMGCCFITSPATLLKTSCFKGTFWAVLESQSLCLPMQGDKFQQKKPEEKSQLCRIYCHTATIVTRDGKSGVWGLTKIPHRDVFFFGGRGRLSKRLQKLESITFYLYCFNPHDLKGCSGF